MMTRQNHRKPLTLPGRYYAAKGRGVDVTLSNISPGGCRFEQEGDALARDARILVHIDDAGPFPAYVRWVRANHVGVVFVTSLDEAQFAHFRNCHLAMRRESDGDLAPDALAQIKPRRYC